MPRRTKAEALETREQIIEAAECVFHSKGVSRTSLNDIAHQAGVTRGAIYWHFKNKHDVFDAMMERLRLPMEALGDRDVDPDEPDPLGRFRAFLIHILRETVHDPRRRRVLEILFHKCEFTADTDPLMARQREAYLDGSERMRPIFHKAIACGQLPADLDVERAVMRLHVLFTGIIYTWLLMPDSFDLEAEAVNFVDCYLAALIHHCNPRINLPTGMFAAENQDDKN